MADRSRIEWCDATWNPCTGCTKVSEACEHCYAERIAGRNLAATRCPECKGSGRQACLDYVPCDLCGGDGNVGFYPTFHPDRLDKPLHWRKPRRIFVCSMSDLFHEAFTDEQIDDVLAIVDRCPQHTFMVLTKRPERMREYVSLVDGVWPLPNLWIGVTVENQQRADERIPILLDTPAAVRFVSVEPMLSEVDLSRYLGVEWMDALDGYGHEMFASLNGQVGKLINWVILGGETGPGARPMQPEWALDVYRQCEAVGVPFFWKQGGPQWCELAALLFDPDYSRMPATREVPEVAS